jgi:hypothetical protein
MLDRLEPVLKGVCAVLAALLLYQLVRLVAHSNPLAHLTIPALPTLPADTNAPASGIASNTLTLTASAKSGTNAPKPGAQSPGKATNAPGMSGALTQGTNSAQASTAKAETNVAMVQPAGKGVTNSSLVSSFTRAGTNSNPASRADRDGTNATSEPVSGTGATNSALLAGPGKRAMPGGPRSGTRPMGMNPSGGPGGAKLPDLPLATLARVDKITDSEILGPVIRPLPMALLGIAGNVAFLRAPNGQTGLVKEGDELSGLKLVRIGINRVLVEQDGKKQELMIFSGYGGESLMPKQKDSSP